MGKEYVGIFITQLNLAQAYTLYKRWKEAEVLLCKLIAIFLSDYPNWIYTMSRYIYVQTKLGQVTEMEKDCNKILDVIIETKILTLDNPRILAIAEQLLKIYHMQGHSDNILVLKRRVPGVNESNNVLKGLFAILYRMYICD